MTSPVLNLCTVDQIYDGVKCVDDYKALSL